MASLEETIASREFMQKWTEEGLEILGPCPPHLKETTIQVPISDGTTFKTIIVQPAGIEGSTKKCPLIVLFHGGSWAVGGPEFCLSPARNFATLFGAIVACPSYQYAPEHPFPGPSQSGWDITAWLSRPENLKNGPLKNSNVEFDPSLGLILGGISAGANLAAVIAGISAKLATDKDSKLAEGLAEITQPIKGLYLSVPVLLHDNIVPAEYAPLWTSRVENANAIGLNADALATTQVRLKADHHSPWYSPLNLDLADIASHHAPRVYQQAGQGDILRDDAVVYERALREKGVAETRLDIIQGVAHVGWCTLPVPESHSDEMRTKSLDGLAWLLNTEWDHSQELSY